LRAISTIGAKARKPGDGGFALLELVVYMVITAVIVGSAIQVLRSTQDSSERATQVADARQNARATIAMLTRDARMAGSGIPAFPVYGSYEDEPFELHPITPCSGAEGIIITGATDSVSTWLRKPMPDYTTHIKCKSIEGFDVGDLVIVSDEVTTHLFQVTAIDADNRKLKHAASSPYNPSEEHANWPATGYARRSVVRKVDIITYYVNENESVMFRDTPSTGAVPLAGGITSVGVNYVLADGQITPNPADLSLVRALRLDVRSRSNEWRPCDPGEQLLSTTVAPRCIIR
jgi:type II secretory pathway pseudopilin PulG